MLSSYLARNVTRGAFTQVFWYTRVNCELWPSAVSSHAEERLRRCRAAVRSLGEGVASFQILPWRSGNGKGSRVSNYTLPSACIRWRRRSSLVVSLFRCHRRCIILRFFLTPSWHILFSHFWFQRKISKFSRTIFWTSQHVHIRCQIPRNLRRN